MGIRTVTEGQLEERRRTLDAAVPEREARSR